MDVLSLCLRYIVSRKIAIVSLFFIMVGVTANIVVIAVMDGFQERIQSHLRGTESDLSITVSGVLPVDHFDRVRRELASEMAPDGPIVALAPHHFELGIIANQQTGPGILPQDMKHAVRIVGIEYELEKHVVPFEKMLTEKIQDEDEALRLSPEDLADPFRERSVPGAIIGTSLARALKLRRGDRFQIITGDFRMDERGSRSSSRTTWASSCSAASTRAGTTTT